MVEANYAVGEFVGFERVKSASRKMKPVRLSSFWMMGLKLKRLMNKYAVVQDTFTPVLPLRIPQKKKKKSNAPPAIKNKELATELSCYGQLASPTEMVLLGGKSPKLNHVVCHRRRVFMPPTDTKAVLNLMFCFKFK